MVLVEFLTCLSLRVRKRSDIWDVYTYFSISIGDLFLGMNEL